MEGQGKHGCAAPPFTGNWLGADVMQAQCSWPHCPGEPPSAGSLPSEAMRLQDGRGADEGVQLTTLAGVPTGGRKRQLVPKVTEDNLYQSQHL